MKNSCAAERVALLRLVGLPAERCSITEVLVVIYRAGGRGRTEVETH
jgi:hypothetical protein